jgi:hypothetical protein
MADVLIRPGNARDFEEQELDALVQAILERDPDLEVRLEQREQRGYAVTWWEVVNFLLTETAGHVIDAVLAAAIVWGRDRLKKARDRDPDRKPRPIWHIIYGPDGEVLKSVKVTDPDEDPEDVTDEERESQKERRRYEAGD